MPGIGIQKDNIPSNHEINSFYSNRKSNSVNSLGSKSNDKRNQKHDHSKSTERKPSSSRPVMKSLDLRTSELNQCKIKMEEK